ncbi:MAG: extracellular solute-binding protein, partial [Burkholderiales bacterium]|nr:extracellular solute-binding protein [Anaerolineae bacterium]
VEIVARLNGFDIDRKLVQDFATGAADYDVAWDHTSFYSAYAPYLEPLNAYFSEEELAAFSPAIIESSTIDGNLYLMPRHSDISVVHYRTDLYEDPANMEAFEAEYGYPLAAPETWQQLGEQARFFADPANNMWGTQWAGKDEGLNGRFMELLQANGGDILDAEFHPIFNNEVGVETATWLHDLYQDGILPPDMTNYVWPEVFNNFCNGSIAVYTEWYGWYSSLQDPDGCPAVAGNFGLVRAPMGTTDRHSGWAGAHGYSIVGTSENKVAAAQLIKFLTSEMVLYEESSQGALPVRDDVWARVIADAETSGVPLDVERLQIAQTQISEDFTTPPLISDWLAVSNIVFPAVQEILITPDIDIQARLDEAAADVEELLDDAGYYS